MFEMAPYRRDLDLGNMEPLCIEQVVISGVGNVSPSDDLAGTGVESCRNYAKGPSILSGLGNAPRGFSSAPVCIAASR